MVRPIKKRRQQTWGEDLTPDAIAWLRGENDAYEFVIDRLPGSPKFDQVGFWREHEAEIVAEHVETHPGSRPRMWWRFSAPEPRKRLGGIGKPWYAGTLELGIPHRSNWITAEKHAERRGAGWPIDKPPIDPRRPPKYESQATFLKRLGLFVGGEEERLGVDDFKPELFTGAPDK